MGTPVYYVILGALLAVLVITLAYLIRKRKHEEEQIRAYQEKMDKLRAKRKAEEEKKQPNWRFWTEENQYTTYNEAEQHSTKWRHGRTYVDDDRHTPKYAAGDDMDRLNRNQGTSDSSNTPFVIALIAVICATAIFATSTSGGTTPTTAQQNNAEKLAFEIVSAEPNQDRTKLYVTLHYKNQSINTCYNIITTVNMDVDGTTVNTKQHTIASLPGGTETEEIVTLTIPGEYQFDAYYVSAKFKCKWKAT